MHVVTLYGPAAGSSRVRVLEWLERIPRDVQAHLYARLSTSLPRALRHPARVVATGRDLRGMGRQRVRCLLAHRGASPPSPGDVEATVAARYSFQAWQGTWRRSAGLDS